MLKVYDVLFSCFIIFPAVILYWSGTWTFLNLIIFPHHQYSGATLLLLVGLFILISGYFALPLLESLVVLEDLQRDFTKHLVVSKIFNYLVAFGYVFQWKGIWMFTELCFGTEMKASVIILCVSSALLLLMRSISNAATVPLSLALDNTQSFYKTAPRFRTQVCITFNSSRHSNTCREGQVVVSSSFSVWKEVL
jgi:small-conductance mechanosensitive channel